MANRNYQELKQWAENVAVPNYGKVTQKIVKSIVLDRANDEELEQGFTRAEIRTITQYVNEINEVKGK